MLTKDSQAKSPQDVQNQTILKDFYSACLSRELSLMMRKEVLSGKAKFGIGGAGKEVPQLALAHVFEKGDFLAGYYRDQTFMLAKGLMTSEDFFAFLYGDSQNDPFSGGRQMNNCFGTDLIDESGNWLPHNQQYNVSSAIAPLAAQAPRSLGLALASKLYRQQEGIQQGFSSKGQEVCFCTIGDASTSEGAFWESVNAAGVMKIPLAFIIWDDGYGISVPTKYQTTKGSISAALEGFRVNEEGEGLDIYKLRAWNYTEMMEGFQKGVQKIRETHTPAIFHVQECTQPQGHSTSGSHERYKSKDRLAWERDFDGIKQMGDWIVEQGLATEQEIQNFKDKARREARAGKDNAWANFNAPHQTAFEKLKAIVAQLQSTSQQTEAVNSIAESLGKEQMPVLSEILRHARQLGFALEEEQPEGIEALNQWIKEAQQTGHDRYHTHLLSETSEAALNVPVVPATYAEDAPLKNGYEILNAFFDQALEKHPELLAFGEDVGKIGDVNQAFVGLQKKYGEERVFDTGIREWTIVGQAIGLAMRGLRPIAEVQYLDYVAYAFAPLTDDLATVRYRTNGRQKAPAIIRTRGHRLEGIWHSGSPMGMLINSMRGIHVLVPRNMTQAAGMYNTILQSDDPALMVECLNGYRHKERMPDNLDRFTIPLGVPEILQEGSDLTLVTYGACVRIAQAGIRLLEARGISVELIDVQTLLPFDLEHRIVESLKKTNRIVFMDEDVPGGATAYMMREVLELQSGYRYLDSAPLTLTAKAHRPPYGDDGNYFSKPNAEDVYEVIYQLIKEAEPQRFE